MSGLVIINENLKISVGAARFGYLLGSTGGGAEISVGGL